MSNRPQPCALTAAILMAACGSNGSCEGAESHHPLPNMADAFSCANLASAIHRLAPACKRLAEAECNGEWRDGQRARVSDLDAHFSKGTHLADLDKSITDYASRLDKRIAKLNAQLAPFGYQLVRSGDPRGATLSMAETPVDDSATHYAIS